MKICHWVHMGIHTSGMYQTIAELIVAENKLGMDAGLIDTNNYAGGHSDDSTGDLIVSKDISWCDDADVLVLSTSIPEDYKRKGIPVVMIMHGCPRDVFESELFDLTPDNPRAFSTIMNYFQSSRFSAFVTFWEEHYHYYKTYVPNCYYVPVGCNLSKWTHKGNKYKFNGGGKPNIVFCEAWRFMKHPYHILHGVALAHESLPDLRLHLYGVPQQDEEIWNSLCRIAKFDIFIGEFDHIITDLDDVYRSADMVITPIEVAHRITREATACGTPVIAAGYEHTSYNFHPFKPNEMAEQIIRCWQDLQADPEKVKKRCQKTAKRYMDVMDTARGMQRIYEKVIEENIKV